MVSFINRRYCSMCTAGSHYYPELEGTEHQMLELRNGGSVSKAAHRGWSSKIRTRRMIIVTSFISHPWSHASVSVSLNLTRSQRSSYPGGMSSMWVQGPELRASGEEWIVNLEKNGRYQKKCLVACLAQSRGSGNIFKLINVFNDKKLRITFYFRYDIFTFSLKCKSVEDFLTLHGEMLYSE